MRLSEGKESDQQNLGRSYPISGRGQGEPDLAGTARDQESSTTQTRPVEPDGGEVLRSSFGPRLQSLGLSQRELVRRVREGQLSLRAQVWSRPSADPERWMWRHGSGYRHPGNERHSSAGSWGVELSGLRPKHLALGKGEP